MKLKLKHTVLLSCLAVAMGASFAANAQDAASSADTPMDATPRLDPAAPNPAPPHPELASVLKDFGGKDGLTAIVATFMDNMMADPRTLLVAGTYVEVKGRYVNGQLLASQIEIKSSGGSGGSTTSPTYGTVKRKGWVTAVSGTTLVLDGALTGDASQAYVEHGSLAQIRTGLRLEVKGTLDASGVLRAYKIELDD